MVIVKQTILEIYILEPFYTLVSERRREVANFSRKKNTLPPINHIKYF